MIVIDRLPSIGPVGGPSSALPGVDTPIHIGGTHTARCAGASSPNLVGAVGRDAPPG